MPGSRFTDVRRFESVDSTNRYLLDEARSGAPEGVVAVAAHQTAGRGRLGRRWEAPPGANLLASVLLRPDLAPGQRHLASAVVALAAADAVAEVTGSRPGIKWPNDLLAADGRKLAGVLAEADATGATATGATATGATASGPTRGAAAPRGGLRPPVVVGIGINVNWPTTDGDVPVELAGTATSLLRLTGRVTDVDLLLGVLLDAVEPRVADLASPGGRVRQADDLRGGCVTLGTTVRVELAGGSFEGRATDLTPDGHLVVEVAGTRRTVVAGDVVHVRPGA